MKLVETLVSVCLLEIILSDIQETPKKWLQHNVSAKLIFTFSNHGYTVADIFVPVSPPMVEGLGGTDKKTSARRLSVNQSNLKQMKIMFLIEQVLWPRCVTSYVVIGFFRGE